MASIAMCIMLCTAYGGGSSLRIDGRRARLTPPLRIIDDQPYVPLNAFAKTLGMEAKFVVENKLVVLCTDAACRPVHLSTGDVHRDADFLFVRLTKLAHAAGYDVSDNEGIISLTPIKSPTDAALQVGSVLPDVVLTDTQGRPVHTSDFIGRRVLFCTWASW